MIRAPSTRSPAKNTGTPNRTDHASKLPSAAFGASRENSGARRKSGTPASITIADDGTVAVNTGCNTGSGSVEIGDDTLTFGPIATTMMACPPEQTELEASVVSVLQGEVSYEIDGSNMSLRSGEGADEIGLELTAS